MLQRGNRPVLPQRLNWSEGAVEYCGEEGLPIACHGIRLTRPTQPSGGQMACIGRRRKHLPFPFDQSTCLGTANALPTNASGQIQDDALLSRSTLRLHTIACSILRDLSIPRFCRRCHGGLRVGDRQQHGKSGGRGVGLGKNEHGEDLVSVLS